MSDYDDVRSSSELADDEGSVFITAVPGAAFQVLGRRDPLTGELCVGSLAYPPPSDFFEKTKCAPPWVEVVTGPEAEDLIARVERKLAAAKKAMT